MNARSVCATVVMCILSLSFAPSGASAHCDTLDGPVVRDARAALEKGDVTPVLKWVRSEYEAEVKEVFEKAASVRTKGADAMELADKYFFETVVRLHRAGEGAPYTGLKPAGAEIGPAVAGADSALETGNVGGLVKFVSEGASEGIRKKFAAAYEAKEHKDESVEAGRKYVESYVEFVHYAERLHEDAEAEPDHRGGEEGPVHETGHVH